MHASDVYKGWLEGEAIAQILRLLGVKSICKTVVDEKHLSKSMTEASRRGAAVFHISVMRIETA